MGHYADMVAAAAAALVLDERGQPINRNQVTDMLVRQYGASERVAWNAAVRATTKKRQQIKQEREEK